MGIASKSALISLIVLLGAFAAYYYLAAKDNPSVQKPPERNSHTSKQQSYKFIDAKQANQILKYVDLLQPVDESSNEHLFAPGDYYIKPFLGLKQDEEYCDKHRAYFTRNPNFIFKELNFMTDWGHDSLMRGKVASVIGNDIQMYISFDMPKSDTREYDIEKNINVYYINGPLDLYQHIGKTFGCQTQMYNHIPGQENLVRKDLVSRSITTYAEKYKDKPQCFSYDRFFPQTWHLLDKAQCIDFFNIFNSQEYAALKAERRIVYIRKKGAAAHRAEGVQPVNEIEEKELREIFGNGTKCGTAYENYIIQNYIHNALLLDGHKFDFRIYMLVASSNPLMLFYHDGFLRLSLHKYNVSSDDKDVLLTNTELSKEIWTETAKGGLFKGMNETELRDFQMWTFPQLQAYLLKTKVITDENWLDNHLRPQFKKAMIHLLRMSQHSFLKWSGVYELLGPDFILDENLNLWFLECNTSPNLQGTSVAKEKFLVEMLTDHYDIIISLLRSRTKRIVNFVNTVIEDAKKSEYPLDKYLSRNFAMLRKDFIDASRNRFEPEFQPRANNTFSKIIDENEEGLDRYAGFIPIECY